MDNETRTTSTGPKTVVKRSGHTVPYDRAKIASAIEGANNECGAPMTEADVNRVTVAVEGRLDSNPSVETVQDVVEHELMAAGFYKVARAYIRYRQRHEVRRQAQKKLMETYHDLFFADAEGMDLKRDNANVNADAPMGVLLKLGTEGAKYYINNYVLTPDVQEAHRDGWIHLHDLDLSLLCVNCEQIDLLKLFRDGGVNTGHGYLRQPQSVRSASALGCIILQSGQNDMLGGQSINCWDYAMAFGVRRSFVKALVANTKRAGVFAQLVDADVDVVTMKATLKNDDCDVVRYAETPEEITNQVNTLRGVLTQVAPKLVDQAEKIYALSCDDVVAETEQAMEAAIHNLNSMHSRAGAQTPFSSLNYGMDTSPEGRLATRMTLRAVDNGLGHGETAIFPISVFQLKAGVNYNPVDPNYDLFKLACKVSARRLFPNFCNIDAPYNLQYYKPGDYNSYVATMGCRTRVMGNVNGPEQSGRRGNFSFVSINLPMLALEAEGDEKRFFELFDKYITMAHDYLQARFEIIAEKKVYNFPFLMGQHLWLDSEKLRWNDPIRDVLKHASLSIGFVGLAEALVALTGHHHGESDASQELGLKIIGHLRDRTDAYTKAEHMNWSTFATPAESTAGSMLRATRKRFGVIPGVTEHEYFTNSSHVPVYYPCTAVHKVEIEAPYHALANAGHIGYIEVDGDPLKNLEAFEALIRLMHDNNMTYFSLNHKVDVCPACGFVGIIDDECPKCGHREIPSRIVKMKLDNDSCGCE